MKSYKSKAFGELITEEKAGFYQAILAILCGVFLFSLLYGFVAQSQIDWWSYAILSGFALVAGLIIGRIFSYPGHSQSRKNIYRQIIEHDSDVVQMVFNVDEQEFGYVSSNIEELLGYKAIDISPSYFRNCFSHEDYQEWLQYFEPDFWLNRNGHQRDFKISTKFGVINWTDWQVKPVRNYEANIDFVLFSFKEINERIRKAQTDSIYLKELEQILEFKEPNENEKSSLPDLEKVNELKEPLCSVKSYLRLIEDRYAAQLDQTGREFLQYINKAIGRMQEMIEDIITYQGIEKEETQLAEVDLNFVWQKVCKSLGSKILETSAQIRVSEMPQLVADDQQLQLLIRNLLKNALTYVQEDVQPLIEFSVQAKENAWVFCMKDNGIGINPDFGSGVFEMFRQVHNTDLYGGTGVGLAICKKIVENHGGEIWFESEGEGRGSRFYFTIPHLKLSAASKSGIVYRAKGLQKLETI